MKNFVWLFIAITMVGCASAQKKAEVVKLDVNNLVTLPSKPTVMIHANIPSSLAKSDDLWVALGFTLQPQSGKRMVQPSNIKLLGSSHLKNSELNQNAIKSVKKWLFKSDAYKSSPKGQWYFVKLNKVTKRGALTADFTSGGK